MPPMDNSMMDGMMAICMIASTLFTLVILVAIIMQTVVQVKILSEIRRLHGTPVGMGRQGAGPQK
jgi:hypothetical protein